MRYTGKYNQSWLYSNTCRVAAHIVTSCAEDVLASSFDGPEATSIVLDAAKFHLVMQWRRFGSTRAALLVDYLIRKYPTYDVPFDLEATVVLELLQHRVMNCLCHSSESKAVRKRRALAEIETFKEQSKWEHLVVRRTACSR